MASRRFGLSLSLKKTEVLFEPSPDNIYATSVTIDNTALVVAETFCYLGSRIHRTGSLDDEIAARLAKATAAFGCLTKRLWDDHGIRVDTKVQVYRAVVLTTLLYDSKTWTLYRRYVKKLDSFHRRCLRRILRIIWLQDRVPNTTVLEQFGTTGIELILFRTQFRWSAHVSHMSDERVRKCMLYGQLPKAKRHPAKKVQRQASCEPETCNI